MDEQFWKVVSEGKVAEAPSKQWEFSGIYWKPEEIEELTTLIYPYMQWRTPIFQQWPVGWQLKHWSKDTYQMQRSWHSTPTIFASDYQTFKIKLLKHMIEQYSEER